MILYIALTMFLTSIYLTLGLGAAIAISKWKQRELQSFHVFLWPFSLAVISLAGDIA